MDRVAQVEVLGQVREVGSPGVHVVAGAGLVGPSVPTTVMRDDAETLLQEEHHLGIPVVCCQRPTVAEDDRLT